MIGFGAMAIRSRAGRNALAALSLILGPLSVASAGEERFVLTGEVHVTEGRLQGQRALVGLRGAHTPFFNQTWTSLGGRFQFEDLPAGVYVLSAQIPGLAASRVSVDVSASLADSKGRIHRVIVLQPGSADDAAQVSVAELSLTPAAWRAYSKAENLLGKGQVDRAVRELNKVVEKEPGFSAAHNMLGTISYQKQDYAQAESHFRKALEADPRAYAPLVNLGGALNSLERFEEAAEVNRRACRARPDDPLANSQLGVSYWALGREAEAIDSLQRAKQLDPGHFSYPQLVLAQIFLSRRDFARTRQELEEFLQLHPDSSNAPRARLLLEQLASAPRHP